MDGMKRAQLYNKSSKSTWLVHKWKGLPKRVFFSCHFELQEGQPFASTFLFEKYGGKASSSTAAANRTKKCGEASFGSRKGFLKPHLGMKNLAAAQIFVGMSRSGRRWHTHYNRTFRKTARKGQTDFFYIVNSQNLVAKWEKFEKFKTIPYKLADSGRCFCVSARILDQFSWFCHH